MIVPSFIAYLVVALISGAFILTFIRLVIGPTLADRVVALELLSIMSIAGIAVTTVLTGQAVFLDVAVVFALVSFLGTVAFAFYLNIQASTRARIREAKSEDETGEEAAS
jgi:multicomponent Na+:H+ antiporter subunit F